MHVLGAAGSPAHAGSRNRNLNFLSGRLVGPMASPLPAGAGEQAGRPAPGHPFPGLLCVWGLGVPGSWDEMTLRNPKQSAWKIPGSLIYSQNMFV